MSFARAELVRLLLIHQELLHPRYPTHARLAELCGVSVRTIKRDMELLRDEFGAPWAYDYQRRGFAYRQPFTLLPQSFSEQELMALCLTLEVADSFRLTPFGPALKGAIAKVQLLQPTSLATGDLPACISKVADPMPPAAVESLIHFNRLMDAIAGARRVRMTYYTITRDAESTREVDPYHLYFSYGMWYLYGFCHARQAPRDFAVTRIRALEVLTKNFAPPDPQWLRERLAARFTNETPATPEAPVEVKIRFDPIGARWIREREWHASQQREDHPDGSCTLTMAVAGLAGVRRWILGFGGRHATPLSPPELVLQVQEEVEAMLRNFQEQRPGKNR
jgi:predicted DNA-binding transcriptional regulator YafY